MGIPHLFGTDGIRGVFGEPPLERQTVRRLGLALAEELAATDPGEAAVLLGGDTRDSTPTLLTWMGEGLAAGGARLELAGTVTTPGVAWLVRRRGLTAGVVVSASHNPHPDNGIKLIDHEGFKWSPAREAALEARLVATSEPPPVPHAPKLRPALVEPYLDGLLAALPGTAPLAGLRLAVDAANGAASPVAAGLFRRAGAEVEVIHASPDGRNINRACGSTHPASLAALTRRGFDLGVALDGDADRAVFVDERGVERDGDAILFLWARDLARRGLLDPKAIVATTMSNLGLERALGREGIAVERSGVGDREVVAMLRARGLVLGGEQSGHLVHLGLATTGDGLLTALVVAEILARAGRPLSELLAGFERFPQILRNVRVREKRPLSALPALAAAERRVLAALGAEGRLVLRYSGTEPLLRIMIEGPDEEQIRTYAREIEAAVERDLP